MSARYSAIAAKLKAMYAKTVSDKEMMYLAEKKTVGEIASYLKSSPAYGDVLEDIDPEDAHRANIELHMEQKLTDDFLRIYKFTDKQFDLIMDFVFSKREVEFIKTELHRIFMGGTAPKYAEMGSFEPFFEHHTKIDYRLMKSAASLDDCVKACADTRYAEPLKRASNLNADAFTIGMMLDGYYFSSAWRIINSKLNRKSAEGVKKIFGTMADMLNLLWIYRGKKYFKFENELIFAYILNVPYKLKQEDIIRLVNTPDTDAFLEEARKTRYKELFRGIEDGIFPERNYRYMLYQNAKSVFRLHTDTPAAILAYDQLKSYEIWRITNIIEGVRYSMSPDAIKAHTRLQV